jgi:ferrous iron transport protein A
MSAIALAALALDTPARLCPPADGLAIPRRLQDLGFVPGTPLVVRRRAPFGDPVEIELRGYRLCLRVEQLAVLRVEVEVDGAGAP